MYNVVLKPLRSACRATPWRLSGVRPPELRRPHPRPKLLGSSGTAPLTPPCATALPIIGSGRQTHGVRLAGVSTVPRLDLTVHAVYVISSPDTDPPLSDTTQGARC